MSGTQAKIEKAAIDAKVAKVREVVRNVSNNDIVLALHNFDMDVNKTIHAFTDAGVESALGDWEKNGAAAKKKKNKAKKAGANGTNSSAASTTTDTPKVSSVSAPIKPTTSAQPSVVPKSATVALPKLSSATEVERLVAELDKKHREVKALLDHAEAQKTLAIDAILNAVNARDRQLAGQLANVRQKAEKQAAQQRALLAQMKQKLARNESAASEMKSFAQGDAFLSEVVGGKFVFDEKPSIRSIDKFGSGYLEAGGLTEAQPAQNGKPKSEKVPNGPGPGNSPVAKLINGAININHSTSQSSLVSSVGEDSGLGQVSPVAHEKVRGQPGDVVTGAEGLSADALADIQRRLAETLKAQGIDTSLISGDTQVGAPRRRPPRRDAQPQKSGQRNGKVIASH